MSKFNQYLYYGIIAIISLLTLFIVPLLGSEIGLVWNVPDTVAGWIVYTVSTLTSTVLNMLMFYSFVKQGKVNAASSEKYQKACKIMEAIGEQKGKKEHLPKSPGQWHKREYLSKASSLATFTLLGTIGFAHAVLTFDLVKFISQAICLVFGLVFGVIEMKNVEEYWSGEYYEYAVYMQKKGEQ